jgi:MFS family permease
VIVNHRQARLLFPLGTALALSLTGDLTLYAVLPNQLETVGIGVGVVGILLGVNRLVRVPGNVLAGALNDQTRRRRLFLLGLVLGIFSTLSYSLVRGFWPFLAGRMLWGTAWALIHVTGYNMVLDWSTPADRGRMTGLYQLAFMLGLAISPVLGGVMTDALGFRSAIRVCAAISAIGLLLALVALPETKSGEGTTSPRLVAGVTRQQVAALVETLRRVDSRILFAAYIYLVTLFVSSGVMMSTLSLYVGQRWGSTISLGGSAVGVASLAGALLAMRALFGMVAGPLAGALTDWLRDRWPVVWGGLLVGIAGFVILALSRELWAMAAGVALVALSAGALVTALFAVVGDLAAGKRQGILVGGLATAGDIGSATGPLVAYALILSVDLRWVYLLCAIALLSAFVASIAQGKRR